LGAFLRDAMLPDIYSAMAERGWPTCPYVNPIRATPDDGIEDFLEVPRFSTGYAALHHCIGFMPETHMLKPFADRYASMRALVEVVLAFTVGHAEQIRALRSAARQAATAQRRWPVLWAPDTARPSAFKFKGYAAVYRPSLLGHYSRLAYDRNQPWEREIPWFNRCTATLKVATPKRYLIPQAWREVIERLQWNGVVLQRLDADQSLRAQVYRVAHVSSRVQPYEGHMFHDTVELTVHTETIQVHAGDVLVDMAQANARYVVETLEPQAHDSFFRWGFFNSVLEKKEAYSDYVFEDTALEMLQDEAGLRTRFEAWKKEFPERLSDQTAVLNFIFANGKRFDEPEWMRYPIVGLF
jgi:hypothetical protein